MCTKYPRCLSKYYKLMLSIDRVGETGAEKLVITKYVTKKKTYAQH